MLNDNQWLADLADFQQEAERLLGNIEECLAHLELIGDDTDAGECLAASLAELAGKASGLGATALAGHCQQLHAWAQSAHAHNRLASSAITALRASLKLLAWQLEFLDADSLGQALEEEEQQLLLTHLQRTLAAQPQQLTLPGHPRRMDTNAEKSEHSV